MENRSKKPKIKSDLKIFQWNARSIKNKITDLKSISEKYDIILISETWLNQEKNVTLPNFNLVRKDRQLKSQHADDRGGVCIFIKKNLTFSEKSEIFNFTKEIEIVAITIKMESNEDILICSIYRPPNQFTSTQVWKKLLDLLSMFKYVVCGGDFNTHHTQWGSYKICPSGQNLSEALHS